MGLSDLFRSKVKYHEGLPSRERLVRIFEEHLLPVLAPVGFTFKPKELEFVRERGDLQHAIEHYANHRNGGTSVDFAPRFTVRSMACRKWEKSDGTELPTGTIWQGSLQDWPGIDTYGLDYNRHWYDLRASDNERLVRAYVGNLTGLVLPRMEAYGTAELALEQLKSEGRDHTAQYVVVACALGQAAEAQRAFQLYAERAQPHLHKPGLPERLERLREKVNALAEN